MEILTPLLFVVVVSVVVQVIKFLEEKLLNRLGERGKDIFYPLLAGILVGIAKVFGLVDLDWNTLLPLLFAPQGVFVVLKKLLGR